MGRIHRWATVMLVVAAIVAACAPGPSPTRGPMPTPTPTPGLRVTPVAPLPPGSGRPPAHIAIPALGVDVAVNPIGWEVVTAARGRTTEWQVLPDAAGHHRGSANPGEAGNVVISGHNTPGGQVFEGLAVLGYDESPPQPGTYAYVTDEGGTVYVYALREKILLPVLGATAEEQHRYLQYSQQTEDARLTLITCWPLGDTAYRLIVWGPLVGTSLP